MPPIEKVIEARPRSVSESVREREARPVLGVSSRRVEFVGTPAPSMTRIERSTRSEGLAAVTATTLRFEAARLNDPAAPVRATQAQFSAYQNRLQSYRDGQLLATSHQLAELRERSPALALLFVRKVASGASPDEVLRFGEALRRKSPEQALTELTGFKQGHSRACAIAASDYLRSQLDFGLSATTTSQALSRHSNALAQRGAQALTQGIDLAADGAIQAQLVADYGSKFVHQEVRGALSSAQWEQLASEQAEGRPVFLHVQGSPGHVLVSMDRETVPGRIAFFDPAFGRVDISLDELRAGKIVARGAAQIIDGLIASEPFAVLPNDWAAKRSAALKATAPSATLEVRAQAANEIAILARLPEIDEPAAKYIRQILARSEGAAREAALSIISASLQTAAIENSADGQIALRARMARLDDAIAAGPLPSQLLLSLISAELPLSRQDFVALSEKFSEPLVAKQFSTLAGKAQTRFVDSLIREAAAARPTLRNAAGVTEEEMAAAAAQLASAKEVGKLQAIIEARDLDKYYDAFIGHKGTPELKAEAEALFNALPALGPNSTAEDFVRAGLWAAAPAALDHLDNTARYLPGRRVLVRTNVEPEYGNSYGASSFLSYKEGGPSAITYRARITAEDGDAFLVKVDGKEEPIRVPKSEIYALNQPHDISTAQKTSNGYKIGNWWGTTANYESPLLKAKVAEAAIKMRGLVAQLDYSKGDAGKTTKLQKQCVQIIHDVINMMYPEGNNLNANGRTHTNDAGRQAVRGIGMCREQASVMMAVLAPFTKALGVDVQFIDGRVYRNHSKGSEFFNQTGSDHGWLQVQYRPSMESYVIDRTWGQSSIELDRAYSKAGDRHPSAREQFMNQREVGASDLLFDGKTTVENAQTQFPKEGEKVGRENHMRNWQGETMVEKPKPPPIAVKRATAVSAEQRTQVETASAAALLERVTKLKDVAGLAEAINGSGDARVTERRAAVAQLMHQSGMHEKLEALGDHVKADIAWINDADRREYTVDGKEQFTWNKAEGYAAAGFIQTEFNNRADAAKKQVEAFEKGEKKFIDASDNSVLSIALIKDPELRAKAEADVLLQLRGRTDKTEQKENSQLNRADRIGLTLVAQTRAWLSGANWSGNDALTQRDYALAWQDVAAHPMTSATGVFEARNTVATMKGMASWVQSETPPGASSSAYESIHHNFSRDTPENIRLVVSEWIFPVGDMAHRAENFVALVDALAIAREGGVASAREKITALAKTHSELADLVAPVLAKPDAEFADGLRDAVAAKAAKPLGTKPEEMLTLSARLYRAVVDSRPTAKTLEESMFAAGSAAPSIAAVIVDMRAGDKLATINDLGEARLQMKKAIVDSTKGYERQERIKIDAQLNRLLNEELGGAVDRLGTLATPESQSEALLALQASLRSASASCLSSIKDVNEVAANRGENLEAVLADVDKAVASGAVESEQYRALMARAYTAIARTIQNTRSFFDARAAAVASGGAQLDPFFMDQFVKETALHYATAIAQKGMRVGLTETITPRSVENVTGMRVLNGIGPVVFRRVLFANSSKELQALGVGKDDLAVLTHLDEKKMVAIGGLLVDTTEAPGGNSHLNMYAMNNGIPVVALPELRTKYAEFFKTAEKEGGVYIDDTNGSFRMLTVDKAIEDGLIPGAAKTNPEASRIAIDKLRPGVNRRIVYEKSNGEQTKHDAIINDQRGTRDVTLYVPEENVQGVGRGAPSFAQLAPLGTKARHLAGEKGTVLALLSEHPVLGKFVPKGSQVTPADIRYLLNEAIVPGTSQRLSERWEAVWSQDPKVGQVTDANLFQSAFYTDAAYRAKTRTELQAQTKAALHALLITGEGAEAKLTPIGEGFYKELLQNPALAESGSWIARSSFTGEDRPGKSGAGQYESFPNLQTPAERMEGIVGVIESTWMAEPIENNVAEQFDLRHIGPTVTVQHCLKPDMSGVLISRDVETGARGDITFQLVKGFGGGVEGGKTTEGVVGRGGVKLSIKNGEAATGSEVDVAGLQVPPEEMKTLRQLVLDTEKYFNETIEPGKGHAVDMEVARENGQWHIVQARVILLGK